MGDTKASNNTLHETKHTGSSILSCRVGLDPIDMYIINIHNIIYYIYIYIHIYKYVYTYVYTYIYIYIHIEHQVIKGLEETKL